MYQETCFVGIKGNSNWFTVKVCTSWPRNRGFHSYFGNVSSYGKSTGQDAMVRK